MNNYTVVDSKDVGNGHFGKAILLRQKAGKKSLCIMKSIELNKYNSDWAYNEAKTLQSLDHPNIVKYIDHFREGNKLYIVMECADGGDLRNKLKNHKYIFHGSYPEHIILQLCEAIKYIHDRDIVHRDLKPANIFLTHDGDVKLGDFGISKQLNGDSIMRYSIYMNYSIYKAPELQKSEHHKPL